MPDQRINYIPPLPIEIDKRDVIHLLGYRKKSNTVPPELERKIDRELFIGKGLLRFKGILLRTAIESDKSKVILANGFIINSAKFAKRVEGCEAAYFFVVTAGALFSERTGQLIKQGEVSLALLADAVGSAAGEACASAANEYINSLEGDRVFTKRYSPGYGDWDVRYNRDLLQMLGSEQIGITVNSGGLMQPEKSVSAAR